VTAGPDRLAAALADRYRLERELGQGGMATVYLAEDLKHHRQVAIKVLRPELAAVLGAERFVQEITTTAALQHPHILPLFDSGTADSFLYYVMPYVEGETLRSKLDREKQLGVDEAVRIAREVADALDYAHRHGVIHRDIKPENILLHDGRPMVADFGIALALSAAAGGRMTETGMSLGTPHYMSPEQATAEKEITARSDVYSLASVLYEMLSGQPPHLGGSAQQIIMKIIAEPVPAVTSLRKNVPANVSDALSQALEKLPADRFDTARAFADALANPGFTLATAATTGAVPASVRVPASARLTVVLGSALAVMTLVAGWALLRPRPEPATSRQRVVLWRRAPGRLLDPGHTRLQASQAAISPDGSTIVYSEPTDSGFLLMRKYRGEAFATPLAGTLGGAAPFFSPDGRWIGYVTTDSRLRKVPVEGGGSVTVAQELSSVSATAAWLDDGTIVYQGADGLRVVSATGDSSRLLQTAARWIGHTVLTVWPLPHSRGFLYTECLGNCAVQSEVRVYDLKADSTWTLVPNAAGAWYAPTGTLLFTDRAGGLYGAAFDADRLVMTSGRVPLIPDVEPGSFALSQTGTVLYTVTGTAGRVPAELVLVARDGSAVPLDPSWQEDFSYPAFSPDGRALAVSVRGEATQLWIRRSDGAREQVTRDGSVNWRPSWTRDGRSLVYVSNREAEAGSFHYDIFRMPVDHSAPPERLVHFTYPAWEAEQSPDGQWIVFRSDEEGQLSVIHARRLAGDTTIQTIIGGGTSFDLALSPDGRWMAYTDGRSGRDQVYVAPFPSGASPRQISQDWGGEARWAHSGRELFYKSGGRLMAVDVAAGASLALGSPHPLFSVLPYRSASNRHQYDVAADDRHFVMIRDLAGATGEVVYAEHWFAELQAKLRP